jgi:hypothetical protein
MPASFRVQTHLIIEGQDVGIDAYFGRLPDEDYIYGWIDLAIGNTKILGKEHVDLVDQLWAYIIDGLSEVFVSNKSWSCYFPDQPLPLAMHLQGVQIEFCVGSTVQSVSKSVLAQAVSTGGSHFFHEMQRLMPDASETWDIYLQKCQALMKAAQRP